MKNFYAEKKEQETMAKSRQDFYKGATPKLNPDAVNGNFQQGWIWVAPAAEPIAKSDKAPEPSAVEVRAAQFLGLDIKR